MPFVTRLTLRSGDRAALDDVVADLRRAAERKGIELKGPHTTPPESYRVPLYRRLGDGGEFPAWEYTVYERILEVVGREEVARQLAGWGFPRGVHVEVDVSQVRSVGSGS